MAESRELKTARRLLAEAEADVTSAAGLARLTEGLGLLDDLVGVGGAESKTARNLAATYAKRVYARVGERLAHDAQLPEPELEHFFKVVLAFDLVGGALPSAAAKIKVAVVRALVERYYEGHPPEKKRAALEQLKNLAGKT